MKKTIFTAAALATILSAADATKVEWTDQSMFKKNWYEAFSYCEENGARLPTDREADTLENSDIHTVGLNYIKARSSEKKLYVWLTMTRTTKMKYYYQI